MTWKVPTLAEMQQTRRAPQKGIPTPVTKVERKKARKAQEAEFRRAVWGRDRGRSRASGRPLHRSGADWAAVGEVHHVIPRSLAPARVFEVANGILLSKLEHQLAETMCPNAPGFWMLEIAGPEDRSQVQTFTWRNVQGHITKTRQG